MKRILDRHRAQLTRDEDRRLWHAIEGALEHRTGRRWGLRLPAAAVAAAAATVLLLAILDRQGPPSPEIPAPLQGRTQSTEADAIRTPSAQGRTSPESRPAETRTAPSTETRSAPGTTMQDAPRADMPVVPAPETKSGESTTGKAGQPGVTGRAPLQATKAKSPKAAQAPPPRAAQPDVTEELEAPPAGGSGGTEGAEKAGRELHHASPREASRLEPGDRSTDRLQSFGALSQRAGSRVYFRGGRSGEVPTAERNEAIVAFEIGDASYRLAADHLRRGVLPPPELIQVEEFVNAFDDPELASRGHEEGSLASGTGSKGESAPASEARGEAGGEPERKTGDEAGTTKGEAVSEPSIRLEAGPSPFGDDHILVRIAVEGGPEDSPEDSTSESSARARLEHVTVMKETRAGDIEVQVAFESSSVLAYRSFGSLFDLHLAGESGDLPLATVHLRFIDASSDRPQEITRSLRPSDISGRLDDLSVGFRLQAMAAEFGEILHRSDPADDERLALLAARIREMERDFSGDVDADIQALADLVARAIAIRSSSPAPVREQAPVSAEPNDR